MGSADFIARGIISRLKYEPTPCQENMIRKISSFLLSDESDIFVINGYAGTGKTSAVAAVVSLLGSLHLKCVLLAPTGRAAKVFSSYASAPAYTIHKHIYRQKSVGGDGFGQFTLAPNKDKDTVYFVDEASLLGIDSMQQQSTQLFGSGNLLDDLVTYVRSAQGNKLVLIGDSAQLPPVGLDASPALSEDYMAMMGNVEWAALTTVVRQPKASGILHNATVLREMIVRCEDFSEDIDDLVPKLSADGFDDVERITGGDLIDCLSDAYSRYGEDDTVILCRSNKRAIRYNQGIRAAVQFKEERLVRGDKLMIVKNCYQFMEDVKGMDYIANGDIARLVRISGYEDRYGLHFAKARLSFPDYDDQEIVANVILDTLCSESASLTYEQQNMLYNGVNEDYGHIRSKKKRYDAVREDKYYNALQLKYANAITCHKSQGGQWKCVFIDNPFWQESLVPDDLKWLYTAVTRGVEKVYFVNFNDKFFEK